MDLLQNLISELNINSSLEITTDHSLYTDTLHAGRGYCPGTGGVDDFSHSHSPL